MVKVIVEVWACDDSGHDTIREIEVRRRDCPSISLTLDHIQTTANIVSNMISDLPLALTKNTPKLAKHEITYRRGCPTSRLEPTCGGLRDGELMIKGKSMNCASLELYYER